MTFTDVHTDRQKLGTILENKVVQKLKFSKNDKNKKPSSAENWFLELDCLQPSAKKAEEDRHIYVDATTSFDNEITPCQLQGLSDVVA